MGFISDIFGGSAAKAAVKGSEIQAGYQREALDYLKQQERLPSEIREQAMRKLAGAYGLVSPGYAPGAPTTQPALPAPGAPTTQPALPAPTMQEQINMEKRPGHLLPTMSEVSPQQVQATPGSVFDTTGDPGYGSQEQIIQEAISSPLYGALMSGRSAGEEAILRSASATGGLRSGNVQSSLYDYNTQLENQALLQSYNQQMSGLGGLAGLSSYAPQIAQQTGAIGTTLGQGQIAAAQAQQAGTQQAGSSLMGLGSLGIAAYGAGMFSDRRLKKNIKLLGPLKGWNVYSWDWNVVAQKMGLIGSSTGCMAEEVFSKRPDAVVLKDLFMFVQYPKIGLV